MALPGIVAPVPAPETEAEESAGALDPQATADDDQRIEARIRGIFAEIPSLANVRVDVSQGVVTLSGTVDDEAASSRAEAIANRFEIATVENAVERDVSVESGVGALAGLTERLVSLWRMTPLLLLALGVALAIAALGYLVAGRERFWTRIAPNPFLAEVLASAVRFGFIVLGLVVALDLIGAAALLGAVLGGAGVIGIALGFAMRDTIENYVASLMLSLRQPFRANDHVIIEGHEGRVIRLTSRATILMTLDGNHVRIPNGQVFKAVITNFTRNPKRRFDFYLGVDADDEPLAAAALGTEVMRDLPFVLDEPAPQARIEEVGDSNIMIRYLAWIDQTQADWFKSRSRALARVKQALEEGGFALPEPIYRLRFDPRTSALPLGQAVAAEMSPPAPAQRKTNVTGDHLTLEHDHTRPESEISDMVAEERSGEAGERDLLDSRRPVE